jgi:ATP-binding cassette subfamily B protein
VNDGGDDDGPALGLAQLLRNLGHHLRPYRAQIAVLVVLLLIDVSLSAGLPLGIKFLVDEAIGPQNRRLLFLILSALVAAELVISAAAIARDWFYAYVGAGVMNDLRLAMFDQIQRLSASFHAESQAGDVLARFTTDLLSVENTVSTVLPWAMMAVLTIVWSLAVLFVLQWQLALLTLTAIPLSLLGPRLLGPRAAAAGYVLKQGEAAVTGSVQESLAGHYVVRAFGLEGRMRKAFMRQLRDIGGQSRRFNFLSGLVQRTPNLAVGLVHVLVLGAAAFLTFRGSLSIGSLLSFDLVFLNFTGSIGSLTEIAPSFLRASGGLARIEELLAEQPSVRDPEKPRTLPRLARAITFRDVSFGYDADQLNLDGLSFEIERGSHVAFVGRSGSGKSTVLSLLLRFHDPTSGSVLIDGVDLREVRQLDARRQMAIVSQESFLFDTTIRENLLAARPSASDAEMEHAASLAEAHTFIDSMAMRYEATVGARGGRLSGGQRQRLAIARALLRDPAILLLDEATSALDAATEAALDRTLAKVGKGRTVVTVTHRLHSIVNADRIFVLDEGRLVEQGRHDDLVLRGGPYSEIWRKQNGLQIGADGTIASIVVERLRLAPLFRDLDPTLLEEVSHRFASEQVPGDRVVLQEGDPGDRFYIIVRGRVAVSKTSEGDAERTVAVLETGDHFGEIALLRDVPSTATVRTLSACMFLTLQRGHFVELIQRIPDLLPALERVAARRAAAEAEELRVIPKSRGPLSLRRAFDAPSSKRSAELVTVGTGPSTSRRWDNDQMPASRLRRPS